MQETIGGEEEMGRPAGKGTLGEGLGLGAQLGVRKGEEVLRAGVGYACARGVVTRTRGRAARGGAHACSESGRRAVEVSAQRPRREWRGSAISDGPDRVSGVFMLWRGSYRVGWSAGPVDHICRDQSRQRAAGCLGLWLGDLGGATLMWCRS